MSEPGFETLLDLSSHPEFAIKNCDVPDCDNCDCVDCDYNCEECDRN